MGLCPVGRHPEVRDSSRHGRLPLGDCAPETVPIDEPALSETMPFEWMVGSSEYRKVSLDRPSPKSQGSRGTDDVANFRLSRRSTRKGERPLNDNSVTRPEQDRLRSQGRLGPSGRSWLRLRMCSVRTEAEWNQDLLTGASARNPARTHPTGG